MEIKELYLGHFGKFHNKEIKLDSGINLAYGANEAGKSTIHSFIRGMFFGIEKKRGRESKDELYSRFQPWETPGAYQGSMLVEKEGRTYQLFRNFLTKERSYSITDLGTGRETEMLFPHFNELVYRNTISIGQLAAGTDKEFAKELQNFIANLSTAQSSEVDIANALQTLKDKRRELEQEERAASGKEQGMLQEIGQLEEKAGRYDELAVELEQLAAARQVAEHEFVQRRKGFLENRTGELSGMMEKFRGYHALEAELEWEQEALNKLDIRMRELEEGTDSESLEEDLKRLNRLQEEQRAFEREADKELDFQEGELGARRRANRIACMVIATVGLLCTVFMAIASKAVGIGTGILLMAAGGILYLLLASRQEKEYQAFQAERQELMARRLDLDDRKKEILVRNYVMDIDALRREYNIRISKEAELRQLAKRRKEYLATSRDKAGRKAKLFHELRDYAARFGMGEFSEGTLTEDTADRMAEQVGRILEEEQAAERAYQELREESLKKEERIRWEMATIAGASVQVEEISKKREECLGRVLDARKEIGAIDLAISVIRELAAEIHDTFGDRLNRNISEKVREITGGSYTDVVMDEQMAVKVLSHNGYLPLEKLSAGTNCQIYMAVRLAMAEAFFPEEAMPLLFDDAFALYDDGRLRAALSYLAGRENQVLIFTCHAREKEMLEQMGICYHEVVW